EQLAQGERRLIEAIKNKYFEKNFTQAFPTESASLAKQYNNDVQFPILNKPMKLFGFVMPPWLSPFFIKYVYEEKRLEKAEQTQSTMTEHQPQSTSELIPPTVQVKE